MGHHGGLPLLMLLGNGMVRTVGFEEATNGRKTWCFILLFFLLCGDLVRPVCRQAVVSSCRPPNDTCIKVDHKQTKVHAACLIQTKHVVSLYVSQGSLATIFYIYQGVALPFISGRHLQYLALPVLCMRAGIDVCFVWNFSPMYLCTGRKVL